MNTELPSNPTADQLRYYYPWYTYITRELQKTANCDLQDIFDEAVLKDYLTATEFDGFIQRIRERNPELGYSQGQNMLFKALGYRSAGLAYEIRKTYTTNKGAAELLYPNLWVEFLYVPLGESVFGSREYCKDGLSLHYLEFVFEPLIRGLVSETQALGFDAELLESTCLTMQMIAQQKTMSIAMARTMATQIEHELSGKVRHTTALNLVAIALGYKTWPTAKNDAVEETITNRRFVSKFGMADVGKWHRPFQADLKQAQQQQPELQPAV